MEGRPLVRESTVTALRSKPAAGAAPAENGHAEESAQAPKAGALGVPDQTLRPVFEGSRLGGNIHRLLATELCAGGLQVFQQNSPGHAIDGQMVNDDEQAGRALRAEIKESSPVSPCRWCESIFPNAPTRSCPSPSIRRAVSCKPA